ncbi:hypothetical protein [Aminipila sp.]|uniref:hypothetical protein n=1 Tax=Aminipila sp. TaxID=2060095 RepID=UPI0028A0590A|nr:hypothetical protein [Aminipila sp.]
MKTFLKRIIKKCAFLCIGILFIRVLCGFRLYSRLKKRYGERSVFLMCPHTGTGDIYEIGIYLREYLNKRKIEESVFLFRGRAEQCVGALFHIDKGAIINDKETIFLSKLLIFVGTETLTIRHLHHIPLTPQTEIAALLEGYNHLSFDDMFRFYTFEFGNEIVNKEKPDFSRSAEAIIKYFTQHGLEKNKTVILSPYASSMPTLPKHMWNELVNRLLDSGYNVVTNCVGEQLPLRNTIAISPSLAEIGPIVELAGYFIGWRSGLCDLISDCKCKKIVLYPYQAPNALWIDWPGKTYEYFRLANCNEREVIEIEFNMEQIAKLPEIIYTEIENKNVCGKITLRDENRGDIFK